MISVVLPLLNQGDRVWPMTEKLKKELMGISSEVIFVDRGSSDDTVFRALTGLNREGMHGCVLQSGRGSAAAAACQAGLSRAEGEFVFFVSDTDRLPDGYLAACVEKARMNEAQILFGYFYDREAQTVERRSMSRAVVNRSGPEYLPAVFSGAFPLQMVQALFRVPFLREKQVYFHEECGCGFDEEFLYTALMRASSVVPVPWKLDILKPYGLEQADSQACRQRVEALLRVRDLAACTASVNLHTQQILQRQVLPSAVVEYIDRMRAEGHKPFEIYRDLHHRGYGKYLHLSRDTTPDLRRRMQEWRTSFLFSGKKEKKPKEKT